MSFLKSDIIFDELQLLGLLGYRMNRIFVCLANVTAVMSKCSITSLFSFLPWSRGREGI